MQTVTTIGLNIAKSIFQVHGIDAGAKLTPRNVRMSVATFARLATASF
jgi:transposase